MINTALDLTANQEPSCCGAFQNTWIFDEIAEPLALFTIISSNAYRNYLRKNSRTQGSSIKTVGASLSNTIVTG